MIVTLDGSRVEKSFDSGLTLRNLLDEMTSTLPTGHLVVSVAVDGQTQGEQELQSALLNPLDAAVQVDLESADRTSVCAAALQDAAAAMDDVGRRETEIADLLNTGQVAEAVRQIGELVQTWQACRDVVVQCSGLLGQDLTQVEFDGRRVDAFFDELVGQLRQVRDALDARDMVLLADLMHYEMPDVCGTWGAMLRSLADGVRDGSLAAS